MIIKILKAPRLNRYQVQSIYGIISGLMPTKSMNVVNQQHFPELMPQFNAALITRILLSQATKKGSNSIYVALSCNCKKACTKRYRCVKNQKFYSQYYHKSEIDYGNMPDTIAKLTKV